MKSSSMGNIEEEWYLGKRYFLSLRTSGVARWNCKHCERFLCLLCGKYSKRTTSTDNSKSIGKKVPDIPLNRNLRFDN